jgi:hypothetical protein
MKPPVTQPLSVECLLEKKINKLGGARLVRLQRVEGK